MRLKIPGLCTGTINIHTQIHLNIKTTFGDNVVFVVVFVIVAGDVVVIDDIRKSRMQLISESDAIKSEFLDLTKQGTRPFKIYLIFHK